MIKQVLVPEDYNFIVTPKEIDDLIENMSSIVARGIKCRGGIYFRPVSEETTDM